MNGYIIEYLFNGNLKTLALMSANIVPSLDIEGGELARILRYPNVGKYSPMSVQ